MDDREKYIPQIAHESDMARMERANNRLWIALILMIVLFVVSNLAWVWYENQYVDEVTTEIEQDTESGSNYIVGGDYHGTSANQNHKDEGA